MRERPTLIQTDRRFFVCYIGKNPRGERVYGVLALLPNTDPPMFRLLTKGQNADDCNLLVVAANVGKPHAIEADESDNLGIGVPKVGCLRTATSPKPGSLPTYASLPLEAMKPGELGGSPQGPGKVVTENDRGFRSEVPE